MVDFPSIVVLIGCLILIDGCGGEVTLQKAKDIRFNTMKEAVVETDSGRAFCFKNRVDCVEYEYNAEGDLLAFIVRKESLTNTLDTPGVSAVDFVPKSNRTGTGSYERVDVDVETGNYCVVFVNGPFKSPFYSGVKNATNVTVHFEIQGCPTKYQKLVAILVPIGAVLLVAVCFSAWWIRRRRRSLKDGKEKHPQSHPPPHHHAHYPSDPNVPYPPSHPPPGHMNGAFPLPAQYTPGHHHQVSNGVPVMPAQMNVPMIPYGNVHGGGHLPSTGVPVPNSQGQGVVQDPSEVVWAAAAERNGAAGLDGRFNNEQEAGNQNGFNLSGVDSRDMNTVPYMSGLVPSRGAENVADSDTRV
ncbi:hypothetical protein BSKO_09153 [Bryopsis sp. KO-2023]|nr:hypothetical protein BSKO_09153 [Bryopsis sp. KO-2023]